MQRLQQRAEAVVPKVLLHALPEDLKNGCLICAQHGALVTGAGSVGSRSRTAPFAREQQACSVLTEALIYLAILPDEAKEEVPGTHRGRCHVPPLGYIEGSCRL